jgi:GT2 family glycosyltransferase
MDINLRRQIDEMRAKKVALIKEYDTSESVNSFIVNGDVMWLDKATRVGLVNSTQVAKAAGAEYIVLWANDKSYNVPCDMMLQMLAVLELYAMECYNVTAEHIAKVNALEDLNRIYNYNYTKGYPKRLTFNF